MRICVYAIALNEAKHVERWLAATKDADVRVVADTGSTDGTPELLEAAGVIVHRITVRPFRFDVARNASLSLVPLDVDVCHALDMDEVPERNFYRKVRKQWVPGAQKAFFQLNTGSAWNCDRLHSRFGWRWVAPCHEVTEWYGDGEPTFCEIRAHVAHEPDRTKSRSQYLPLLELAVRESPQDKRMWVYLAREYYYAGNWGRVLEVADTALGLEPWLPEAAAVCRWAAQSAENAGLGKSVVTGWYARGVELNPGEQEPWFGIAIDAYKNQQWDACLDASMRILELPRTTHYLYDHNIADWQAYDLAAISAWNLGQRTEALLFSREALKGSPPEADRIRRNIEFMENTDGM